LVVVMVRNGGLRRAIKACGYVAAWGIAEQALGHDPTWQEYEDYWKCSNSTHARESRALRACVGDVSVSELWHEIRRQVVGRRDLGEATSLVMAARRPS
jgi:hypothetical protein